LIEEDDTPTPSMKKKKLNALFATLRGREFGST
jgi:hypothetical protein